MSALLAVASLDTASLVATISQLIEERQRLRGELELVRYHAEMQSRTVTNYSMQVAQLSSQVASLQASLHAILHLQHVVRGHTQPDEGFSDDEEESLLELYELRRWKQQFAEDQTRSLMSRLNDLQAEVKRLQLDK